MSEIEDIFSARPGNVKAVQPTAPKSTSPAVRKKNKKRKREPEPILQTQPKSRPVPETIIDPSALISHVKRHKINKTKEVKLVKKSDLADERKFKDSRGSGSRGKTEEGWSIYKEEELGIGNEGGDTELCPFDCECCF